MAFCFQASGNPEVNFSHEQAWYPPDISVLSGNFPSVRGSCAAWGDEGMGAVGTPHLSKLPPAHLVISAVRPLLGSGGSLSPT